MFEYKDREIYLVCGCTDMRKGIDGLSAIMSLRLKGYLHTDGYAGYKTLQKKMHLKPHIRNHAQHPAGQIPYTAVMEQ